MTTKVPQVNYSATVLDACTIMNDGGSSGAVVFQTGQPMGLLTDRVLLRNFFAMNKQPGEVKVGEVMIPLFRISADASTKEAVKKIVQNGITKLGVFEGDKFLGWVTLADLAREASKKNLLDALLNHNKPEPKQVLCPKCRKAFLQKIMNMEGEVVRWQCTKCAYTL
jgi:signal-transduction protein with cAMP-binding, CBS, and nucleotidyltransferase domain